VKTYVRREVLIKKEGWVRWGLPLGLGMVVREQEMSYERCWHETQRRCFLMLRVRRLLDNWGQSSSKDHGVAMSLEKVQ
jgi:hypothetical protein